MSTQEYLERISRLLTKENVVLTISSDSPYVKFPQNTENGLTPYHINISNSDFFTTSRAWGKYQEFDMKKVANTMNISLDHLSLMMQRLCTFHECAHILYSPRCIIPKYKNSLMKECINIVDDCVIEYSFSKQFPIVRNKFYLLNMIALSFSNMFHEMIDKNEDITDENIEPEIKLRLACVIAGLYYFGLCDHIPTHPLSRKILEVMNLTRSTSITNKKELELAEEIYEMLHDENIKESIANDFKGMVSSFGDKSEQGGNESNTESNNNENNTSQKELSKSIADIISAGFKDSINAELEEISSEIEKGNGLLKGYGHTDKETDMDTSVFIDHELVGMMGEQLKMLSGNIPSRKDRLAHNGYSLDVGGFLNAKFNKNLETPFMYTNGKKTRVKMNVALCLDRSGSMYFNDGIKTAKKALINICGACEMANINTMGIVFDSYSEIIKEFNEPIQVSKAGKVDIGGGTDISVGVKTAVDELRKIDTPDTKNAIIIISDGMDNTWDRISRHVKDLDVSLYVMGINSDIENFTKNLYNSGCNIGGHTNIKDVNNLSDNLYAFVLDFIKDSNDSVYNR